MSIIEHIISAVRCLSASKMRTFLTTLGIIVGISSVILINTIGSTIGKTIDTNISGLMSGSELDITFIDYENYTYTLGDSADEVTEIADNILGEHATRLIIYPMGLFDISTSYENETDKDNDKISDSVPVYLTGGSVSTKQAYANEMVEGRYISDDDIANRRATAVISDYAAEKLFGKDVSALGKQIDINEVASFTVVGVFKDKLASTNSLLLGEEVETTFVIPYTYAEELFGEAENDMLIYLIDKEVDSDKVTKELNTELKPYADELDKEVYIYSMTETLNIINSVISVITKLIAAIAAVSLLVGGIGVMNIMLVSVTERTMEIGVRKAMGADNKSIRLQFITESIMISLLGSVIGIIIGLVNAKLLAIIAVKITSGMNMAISIDLGVPVTAIIMSVVFSFAVGLIFGVYPAEKAARMQVVDALRYE